MTSIMADQKSQNIIEAVKSYGKKLFSFIRGRVDTTEDAEDILQDVWYQFSNVLNSQPVEQTGAWLYRVARNRIIDKYRKPKTDSLDEVLEDEGENEVGIRELWLTVSETAETDMFREMFWEQLFEALKELPEEQRQVFIWNELDDLSFNEISERTGEKVNTLISRKRYAVIHLRKRLEELYEEIIQP